MAELKYTQEEIDSIQKELSGLRDLYRSGQVQQISKIERQILEFCHSRDMIKFLREEFDKHKIVLNEQGELVGENPFRREENRSVISESPFKTDENVKKNTGYERPNYDRPNYDSGRYKWNL